MENSHLQKASGHGTAHTNTYMTEQNQSSKKGVTITFYNEKEHLCLGVGLRANLLQVMDGMQCPRNEAPNNAALQPITFVNKCLSSTKS